MALSTKPYKGARDFYPEDKRLQNYMFGKLREAVRRYGYEEYDAPILEPLDIYLAKSGDEIVNDQTYTFEDRGGRKVVIRPEMTPTVSRMVAGRRQELAYPLRWFSIPNLWRYERPQRGRLREHWQLNVDIFGVETIDAEQELIMLVDDIFKSFGADSRMYDIRINSRILINELFTDILKLSSEQGRDAGKLIDRMHKMDRSKFLAELDGIFTDEQRAQGAAETLLSVVEAGSIQDLPQTVRQTDGAKQLEELLRRLQDLGISNARFDGSIMRGFDYYTGIVFEVFDTDPENNRAMLGGGRYDGLVGLFGVSPVPTVGFGWGDVTLANFLEAHHLLPAGKPETDVYAVIIGDVKQQALKVIESMRKTGVNIAVDLGSKRIGDALKTAEKKGVAYVLIIGENELASGAYTLKNLATGEETTVDTESIKTRIGA